MAERSLRLDISGCSNRAHINLYTWHSYLVNISTFCIMAGRFVESRLMNDSGEEFKITAYLDCVDIFMPKRVGEDGGFKKYEEKILQAIENASDKSLQTWINASQAINDVLVQHYVSGCDQEVHEEG
ncbi:uncharacterized protein LOC129770159 [Toxorhynchites rutilus septentrionalis]|uniref:uncharacterized protein LOC129770159 n=1 Tax=Toxorhynchites rutilus septentrionalis TaxID=329112 RepID=UPI00247A4418|nr:uncharacterized protein LOC129770159 [Toxorhynchites rutilus septentrionalis]XP_055628791.1 uncharacterized protein LOC129770159 [Toxorhynchites rutilus septentrionalis]